MSNNQFIERYFNIKGKFLELKDLVQKSCSKFICLGVSSALIYFDDFKMTIDEELQEINLELFLNSKCIGSLNIRPANNSQVKG